MAGVLLEMVNGLAVLGIAVLMFPFLKQYGESVALGYVGLRVLECGMQVAMDMSPLSLLTVSREFLRSGATDISSLQIMGTMYLAEREAAALMLLIFFASGALLFYYLLYRSQLVPKFISIWGVIALVLVVTMNILEVKDMSLGITLALPIIANEIFLACWLIFKGFDPLTVVSRQDDTNLNHTYLYPSKA